jgi:hypothetical protein
LVVEASTTPSSCCTPAGTPGPVPVHEADHATVARTGKPPAYLVDARWKVSVHAALSGVPFA